MRCSSCSAPVRPLVAVDIDGTLGNYHRHFLEFAYRYLGLGAPPGFNGYDGTESFRDWFCQTLGEDVKTWKEIKLAYRQGGMKRTMPMLPYADLLIHRLRTEAEVWLTTTRPYLRLDNIDPDTRFWLEWNRITYDGLLYGDDKYSQLAEAVDQERVVAVLDDLLDMCQEASRWGFPAILRRTDWNRGVAWDPTAERLQHAEEIILGRIKDWRERYDG